MICYFVFCNMILFYICCIIWYYIIHDQFCILWYMILSQTTQQYLIIWYKRSLTVTMIFRYRCWDQGGLIKVMLCLAELFNLWLPDFTYNHVFQYLKGIQLKNVGIDVVLDNDTIGLINAEDSINITSFDTAIILPKDLVQGIFLKPQF